MKKLIILPGMWDHTNEEMYQNIEDNLKNDFDIILKNFKWNHSTVNTLTKDLNNFLSKIDTKNSIILSFSFSGIILFNLLDKYHFNKVFLCSISPFFKENISKLPKEAKKIIGKRRLKQLKNISNKQDVIKQDIIFLFGDQDWPMGIENSKIMAKNYKSMFKIVKNTKHEINQEYINIIKKAL